MGDDNVRTIKWLILTALLLLAFSMFIGPVKILPYAVLHDWRLREIIKIRLLRTLLAFAAGGGLALSGVILQAILRNPLAEPFVLGVSSGAGLGASIGLMFFAAGLAGIFSFSGGLLTIIAVLVIARVDKRLTAENLIISGIVINAFFSSILMFLISYYPGVRLHSIIWWLLGNTHIYTGRGLLFLFPIVLGAAGLAFLFSNQLNALSLGEEEAVHLGVDVETVKRSFLVIVALVASAVVSLCGIIGFVGLIVPHVMRRITGPDHRKLVPESFFAGGIFLVVCDMVSRVAMAPREIPIGVITAFTGVPFFIYILRKTRRLYFE